MSLLVPLRRSAAASTTLYSSKNFSVSFSFFSFCLFAVQNNFTQDTRASLVQQHEEFGPRLRKAELSAVQLFIKHNGKRAGKGQTRKAGRQAKSIQWELAKSLRNIHKE